MRKLHKSIVKDMMQSKLQYGGVVTLIVFGVLLYVMLSSAVHTIETSSNVFKEEYEQEDFHFSVSDALTEDEISTLKENYDVHMEERLQRDLDVSADSTIRVFSLPESVNLPHVESGELPNSPKELAVAATYASANELKVGDTVTVSNQDFTISGLIYLPDYIYSLKNETDIIGDPNAFGVGLMTSEGMKDLTGVSTYYIGKWEGEPKASMLKGAVSSMSPLLSWTDKEDNPRISYIEAEIEGTKSFTTVLPLFVGIIALLMVVILVKRRLETQRKQIGTQLALGYQSDELTRAYLLYPLVVAVLGSLLGIILGLVLSIPITNVYTFYFNLPVLTQWDLPVLPLLLSIIVPIVLLISVSVFVIQKQVKQLPIHLIRSNRQEKSSRKGLQLTSINSFKTRFKVRMLTKNVGRILYLMLGIIFATMLLMFGFISMNSIDQLTEKTFNQGMKYDYAIYYSSIQEGQGSNPNTFSLGEGEVLTVTKNEKTHDSEVSLQLFGVSEDVTTLHLMNEEEEDLRPLLSKGIILNQVSSLALGVGVGDVIELEMTTSDKTIETEVVGIAELYSGTMAYTHIERLNEWNELPPASYLGEWASEKPEPSDSIFKIESKKDMMLSLESMMGPMNYSLFIMAGLAFVIGFIIITLITNLIVDENTTTISLMKVIGYEDQTVSQWILNIYTPVVLVAYCIGVPLAMVSIDGMLKSFATETNFALPISISPITFFIGFLIILASYYTSLWLAKRKVKKVSLQEVLKRQEA
ncbi:hypothetical protein Q73_08790 [Bacillus coahuilensis m2-6]|uniref:ABC transporter permease n=1 Tax=Bacillus coahuilensis TaxID=408580 RepID=UPI0007501278|nr:ABC transporter permease [Bacillus coahuilensis]KUP07469.1 hypothetical protein Q73_08790 [Bacillus coahuilensis m2-6]